MAYMKLTTHTQSNYEVGMEEASSGSKELTGENTMLECAI